MARASLDGASSELPEGSRAGFSRPLSYWKTSPWQTWLQGSYHPHFSLHEIPENHLHVRQGRCHGAVRSCDTVTVPACTCPVSARERLVTAHCPPATWRRRPPCRRGGRSDSLPGSPSGGSTRIEEAEGTRASRGLRPARRVPVPAGPRGPRADRRVCASVSSWAEHTQNSVSFRSLEDAA